MAFEVGHLTAVKNPMRALFLRTVCMQQQEDLYFLTLVQNINILLLSGSRFFVLLCLISVLIH